MDAGGAEQTDGRHMRTLSELRRIVDVADGLIQPQHSGCDSTQPRADYAGRHDVGDGHSRARTLVRCPARRDVRRAAGLSARQTVEARKLHHVGDGAAEAESGAQLDVLQVGLAKLEVLIGGVLPYFDDSIDPKHQHDQQNFSSFKRKLKKYLFNISF